MLSNWLTLIYFFESATFLLSVIFYRSLKRNKLVTLPYFLFFILAGEVLALYIAKRYHNNIDYYNAFSTLQIGYYLLLIHSSICSGKAKKVLAGCIAFFFLASIINYYLVRGNNELISYSFTIGCLFITLGSAYFFYELLLSTNLETYTTYPLFWIMLGLFIFYVCNIPYMSVYNFLSINYKTICNAYFTIIFILNYI